MGLKISRCTFHSSQPYIIQIMKKRIFLKILVGAVSLMLVIKLLTTIFIEPWLGGRIRSELNGEGRNYIVEIDKVHILIFKSGIELEGIVLYSKHGDPDLNGEMESVKLKGIKLFKAILKHDIRIRTVTISNSSLVGRIPFLKDTIPPLVSPVSLRITNLIFNKIDLEIGNLLNAQSCSVKEGFVKIYDLQVDKLDTLFPGIIRQFDFSADELLSVRADSMYSYKANGILYSAASNTLELDSLKIQPNFDDYDFTSRYKFQMSRFEAGLSNINVYDFVASDYFRNRSLISSYVEIGEMNMKVFRDKRKEFRHLIKPAFQDMIYNYPGPLQIDSIRLLDGNVTFTVHAEEANEAGIIRFNEINSKLYNITNNAIYKTESAFIELKADALLMGKGKFNIHLKARLFDSNNTFSLNGSLSDMEANELNPILEKNAYIYATSGKIDKMSFSFSADNKNANGKMTMLYHGLNITVKNKRTDDTTAFKERFISYIANRRVMDSNPVAGEDVRDGIIYFDRDPERFLFHYCFRSILSGITSSLAKNPQ